MVPRRSAPDPLDVASNMLPGHSPVLHPRSECELVCALAVLKAHGVSSFVHNARFGALFQGPPIPHYNERAIFVRSEQVDVARRALSGVEGRNRLFHPSRSPCDRARVVAELVFLGWFIPGSSARSRPFRALALSILTTFLLAVLLAALLATTSYMGYRWNVLNAKRKAREATSNNSLERITGLSPVAAQLMIR